MNRMTKTLVIGALLWGGGAIGFVHPVSAQQTETLTIAVAPAGTDTWPVFVGVEKGFFVKHGLDLKTFTAVQSGPEANRVMQAGDADLSATGSGPAAAAKAAGVPLKMVVLLSGGYRNDDIYATVTVDGNGIRPGHTEDLAGKRIGITFGTTPHEQLLGMLKEKNIDPASVQLSNIKPSDLPIALQQKSVDAVVAWEPVVTNMLATIPGAQIVSRGGGYVSGNAGIAAMESVIEQKPEAVRRFVAALSETNRWMRSNLDEVAEIGTRVQTGLELETAKAVLPFTGFDPRITLKNIKGMEEGNQFLVDQGRLEKQVDVADMVEASFINQVMREHPEFFDDLPPVAEEDIIQ